MEKQKDKSKNVKNSSKMQKAGRRNGLRKGFKTLGVRPSERKRAKHTIGDDLMPEMIFEPLQGVGPFRFGEMIEPLVDKIGLIGVPEGDDDITGWIGYTMPEQDICIYSEDGKIVSVACYEGCWYKGKNLIGSTLQDVVRLLGPANLSDEPNVIEIDEEEEVVYEIESAEVQLWIRDGVIVTVFCSPKAP